MMGLEMRLQDSFPVPVRPVEIADWPQTWRESYHYDRLEVWKAASDIDRQTIGYVCGYASRRRQTIEAVLEACPPPSRVLDLAAAQGNFSIALAGLGYQVTWNDLRAELVDYVRLKLPPGINVEFVAGNVFELTDAHTAKYDVVVATEVIEHVAHPDDFVMKLSSLIRPGGVIVLSTPNGGYFLNNLPRFSDCPDPSVFERIQFKPTSDGHIFLLYEDEIRSFAASAGLEVKRFDYITSPLTAGHIKLRYLLDLLPNSTVRTLERFARRLPRSLRSRVLVHMVTVLEKSAA
jgi:2-polyprenyl-3-methyl-5-hydroxy-6-metoxy-1,4-benzoquinol methylase